MKRYRLAIVEQSAVIAEGLRSMLRGDGEFEVVFADTELRTLSERFSVVEPDVVLVNSQIAGTLSQNIRSTYPEMQHTALAALATTVRDDELMRQFDGTVNLYDGQMQILRKLRAASRNRDVSPHKVNNEISEREREILVLVASGMTNKEIADRLSISIHTVIAHRKNISHKTGIKSVAGLTVYALMNNMIDRNSIDL